MRFIGTIIFLFALFVQAHGQTANFTISTTEGSFCAPQVVTVQQTSTGNPESFVWDFGNGKAGNQAIEHITYLTPGTYTIRLIAIYRNIAVTKERTITINPSPTINLHTQRTNFCKTGEISFNASGSNIQFYVWNFDDGSPEITTTSNSIQHNFSDFGNYNVTVKGYNPFNCYQSATKAISITPVSLSGTVSITQGCIPARPQLRIQTGLLRDDSIAEVIWEFGDNTPPEINNSNNVRHTYNITEPITEASVSLSTHLGCQASFTFPEFGYGTPPIATNLTMPAAGDTFCGSEQIEMQATANGANYFVWQFGDGEMDSISLNNTRHKYKKLGDMSVIVTPYLHGCAGNKDSIPIFIKGVIAKFKEGNFCNALNTYQFQNLSLGSIDEFKWTFSDVPIQQDTFNFNASHSFPQQGNFNTKLWLADFETGCLDSIQKPIYTALPLLLADKYAVCKDSAIRYFIEQDYSPEAKFIYEFNINGEVLNNGQTNSLSYYPENFGLYNDYVVIKDNNPLTCNDTVHLSTPVRVKGPVANFDITRSVCFDSTVSINNLSYPFYSYEPITSFEWDYGNNEKATGPQPEPYYYPRAGKYNVKLIVTDIGGCKQQVFQSLTIHPLPIVDILPRHDTICLGDSVQLIAYSSDDITWNNQPFMSCRQCDTTNVNPTQSINYIVNALSEFGCKIQDSVMIKVFVPPTASLSAEPERVCHGQPATLTLHTEDESVINWIPASGINSINNQTASVTPLPDNRYSVIVSDKMGCFFDTASISIIVHPLPLVNAGPDIVGEFNSMLTLQPVYDNHIVSYSWSPVGGSLSCDHCAYPTIILTMPQEYTITVKDQNGCESEDKIKVSFNCNSGRLLLPNAFTPNGDGLNDYFYPIAQGIDKIISFMIYDRRGFKIFERNNFSPNAASLGWNGTIGSKQVQTTQTFVWAAQVECEGTLITHKGTVTLIR